MVQPATTLTRALMRGLFVALMYFAALAFGLLGAVVVPVYATFMVIWMHAPLGNVLVSAMIAAAVMLLLSWSATRLARRRL